MTTEYVVTSDRLSRKRGETFTADEVSPNLAALVAGGHLSEKPESKTSGHPATSKKED
jgi:hypothetical protein